MSALFSIDVRLCATVYVKANTKKAAREKVEEFMKQGFEFQGDEVSELRFDDPELPKISFSPAMTGNGIWPNATVERKFP